MPAFHTIQYTDASTAGYNTHTRTYARTHLCNVHSIATVGDSYATPNMFTYLINLWQQICSKQNYSVSLN